MSTPISGINNRPSSITGSLALTSVGGAIGWVCCFGSVLVVVVVVVVDVVVVVLVDVVEVVVLVVVGGSVVEVVLVAVVGATVLVTVVIAACAVPSSSVPAHDVISNVPTSTEAIVATEARRADASEDPPFPRANIGSIMSNNHRRSPAIA
jgi:hypothetical protein